MKTSSCLICTGKDIFFVTKRDGASFYQCMFCKTIFQNPIPSENDLKIYYEKMYKKENISSSTEKAFENFNPKQEKGRLKAIEKYKTQGKLLDVGASSGFFLKIVNEHKTWKASGLEYSLAAVKKAKKNGISIIHGDITNSNIKNNSYDVITMHSVLEHVSSPQKYVREVNKKLKKNGLFVVSVPNISSFEYFIYNLLHKIFPGYIKEHIFYYSPYSFKYLLEENNFELLTLTSSHYSTITTPPIRPLIGWLTFFPKLFLEYTDVGGKFVKGNLLYAYAKKNNE